MQIQGRVWVVTGGGDGMGRELVLELLRRGGRVAAVDRSAEALAGTLERAQAGQRISTHVLDITDRDGVDALPAAVLAAHGAVDGLVNNAGIIQPFVPVGELEESVVERVLAVNFEGGLRLVRAFLPHLLARPEAHVVNVASMAGFFPFPGQTVYGASKAAVKLLTEGLYAELLDTSVRVTLILPGAIDTSITANSGVPAPEGTEGASVPMTAPDKAARLMVAGIEKNRLHVFVGLDARLMDLAIRIAPGPAIRFVRRQMGKRMAVSTAVEASGGR